MIDRLTFEVELVRDEGERLYAYQDSLGFWTIGVGRLIDKTRGGGISREESRYLLNNDIDQVDRRLREQAPWIARLDPIRQRVLYHMAFQLGVGQDGQPGGLLGFRRTVAAVRAGRYDDAAVYMLQSKWAREDSPARALRLAEMMRTGRDQA